MRERSGVSVYSSRGRIYCERVLRLLASRDPAGPGLYNALGRAFLPSCSAALRFSFALRPSFASGARDLGWCDHERPRWVGRSSTESIALPRASFTRARRAGFCHRVGALRQRGSGLHRALPRPKHPRTLPASPAVLAQNTRRYGHPSSGAPDPTSGWDYAAP
jgi:hypothetical protein